MVQQTQAEVGRKHHFAAGSASVAGHAWAASQLRRRCSSGLVPRCRNLPAVMLPPGCSAGAASAAAQNAAGMPSPLPQLAAYQRDLEAAQEADDVCRQEASRSACVPSVPWLVYNLHPHRPAHTPFSPNHHHDCLAACCRRRARRPRAAPLRTPPAQPTNVPTPCSSARQPPADASRICSGRRPRSGRPGAPSWPPLAGRRRCGWRARCSAARGSSAGRPSGRSGSTLLWRTAGGGGRLEAQG